MTWVPLLLAGLLELICLVAIRRSRGFTHWAPVAITLIAASGAALLLFFAVHLLPSSASLLPISTAYLIWSGVGAVGAVLGGVLFGALLLGTPFLRKPSNAIRTLSAILFIAAVLLAETPMF